MWGDPALQGGRICLQSASVSCLKVVLGIVMVMSQGGHS